MKHLKIIQAEFFRFKRAEQDATSREKLLKIGLLLSFLVINSLATSCKTTKKPDVIIIDPVNAVEREVKLSNFTDHITYIPLESEVIFNNPFSIITTKDHFVLSTFPSNILVFTRSGDFISEIGKVGKGPGEYLFPKHLTYDQNEGLIYIYDNKRILKYDLSGNFINELKLEKFNSGFHDLNLHNEKIYLAGGIHFGNAIYDWIIIDNSLNLRSYKLNHIGSFGAMGDGTIISEGRGGFFSYSGDIYFWNSFNDTIFSIEPNSYKPAIVFEPGIFKHPHQPILFADRSKYFSPRTIFGTNNFLFLSYVLDSYQYTAFFDKNDRNFKIINKSTNLNISDMPGIKNDLDDGPDFPPMYYFQENGEEYLLGWLHAFKFKAHVESEAFKNSTPKYPEKKKAIEELALRLDENDNPVLMLVKLKE